MKPRMALVGVGLMAALAWTTPASARRPLPAVPASPAAPACGGATATKLVAALGVRTASPIGIGESCPGVRPGAVLQIPSKGAQCTFNFLFKGSDGARYAATAGHCVLLGSGTDEKVWPVGQGPAAQDGSGKRVGEFAYAVLRDPKDLALIRLDPGVQASPEMCHFGGPTRMNADHTPNAVTLNHFGQGVALGAAVPARTELASDLSDPDRVFAVGLVVSGDSGSPVETTDGGAIGVVVSTGAAAGATTAGTPFVADIVVTRFAPQLAEASRQTGVTYAVMTAPLR